MECWGGSESHNIMFAALPLPTFLREKEGEEGGLIRELSAKSEEYGKCI